MFIGTTTWLYRLDAVYDHAQEISSTPSPKWSKLCKSLVKYGCRSHAGGIVDTEVATRAIYQPSWSFHFLEDTLEIFPLYATSIWINLSIYSNPIQSRTEPNQVIKSRQISSNPPECALCICNSHMEMYNTWEPSPSVAGQSEGLDRCLGRSQIEPKGTAFSVPDWYLACKVIHKYYLCHIYSRISRKLVKKLWAIALLPFLGSSYTKAFSASVFSSWLRISAPFPNSFRNRDLSRGAVTEVWSTYHWRVSVVMPKLFSSFLVIPRSQL